MPPSAKKSRDFLDRIAGLQEIFFDADFEEK